MSDARAAVDRSFEQLYRGHHADVFRAALRELGNVHDAEDVTQAAFVDAYRAVLRGSEPQSPRAWLLAIAENVRRRRYRTAQRRPREEPIDADVPLASDSSHELARTLADALASLPDEQRQVFVLRELGGLSYEEIADEVGSTVGAIQMLLFRARRSLRERLDPPAVGRRRPGIVLPLPGWLTGVFSRAELTTLFPRAAGAVGAGVVAVVGATVAVDEVQADRTPLQRVQAPPALVSQGERGSAVQAAPARALRQVQRGNVRPAGGVAARSRGTTPTRVPATVAAPSPAAAPESDTPPVVQPAAPTSASARAVPELTEAPAELPALEPPRVPVPVVEEVTELLEPPVPPPSTAPVLEAAAGAVSAAGAGAPPLPVPDVPPVTLPPAP